MAASHSPEPWRLRNLDHYDRKTEIWCAQVDGLGELPILDCYPSEADAAHIVACVNALAGLNPSAIKELLEAADAAVAYGVTDRLRLALEKVRQP